MENTDKNLIQTLFQSLDPTMVVADNKSVYFYTTGNCVSVEVCNDRNLDKYPFIWVKGIDNNINKLDFYMMYCMNIDAFGVKFDEARKSIYKSPNVNELLVKKVKVVLALFDDESGYFDRRAYEPDVCDLGGRRNISISSQV